MKCSNCGLRIRCHAVYAVPIKRMGMEYQCSAQCRDAVWREEREAREAELVAKRIAYLDPDNVATLELERMVGV